MKMLMEIDPLPMRGSLVMTMVMISPSRREVSPAEQLRRSPRLVPPRFRLVVAEFSPVSSKVERERRKAQLLSQIQQQRLDLSASRREWLETTGAYDRRWNMLLSLRSWALVGSSVMAIWTIRHPNMLVRWARRGFGVWSAWRLVKTTLKQQQLRG